MEENDYHNNFKVHSTNSFGRGTKTNMQVANISLLSLTLSAYPTPTPTPGSGGENVFAKMTAKDDSTIGCSHFVAERCVLANLKKKSVRGW